MGKTIIFGATGKLGAYVALYLKDCGHEVIAVGRRVSDNDFFKDYDIPYYSVDIEKEGEFEKLPQSGVENVLHFAATMPAAMSGYDSGIYVTNIIGGTLNVLKYCVKINASRVVYTQSHADTAHLQGSTELIPADIQRSFPLTGDHSIYSICKNTTVDLIEHFYHQFGLKRFVLRLPTIYTYIPDPFFYVNGKRQMRAYRYIIEKVRKAEPVEIWGNPELKKEIVYIKDFCRIVEKATESTKEGGMYNVGRGIGVSLDEQIKGIIDVFSPSNQKSEIVYCPDKPNGKQFIHDISKTINELGYQPKYNYRQGLKDFKIEMEMNRFSKLWGDPVEN